MILSPYFDPISGFLTIDIPGKSEKRREKGETGIGSGNFRGALPRSNDNYNSKLKFFPRDGLKIEEKRPHGTSATFPKELTFELEEDAQHLGDRKDDLAVRNVEEELLAHPLAPFLKPLGMQAVRKLFSSF